MPSDILPSDADALAEELERLGYSALFRLPDSHQRIDDLWSEADAPERVLSLALDSTRSWLTRFLATEIILRKQMFMLPPEHYPSLAPVYARALAMNASVFMADWGFLTNMSDTGKLGSRFILFGRDSDAPLIPLLDDVREVPYVYPPDFPSQIRLGFRLQDFAALYLSKIHGIPILLTDDRAQRDEEIRRLKGLLP